MIDERSLIRFERVKLLVRDERRAAVVRAEDSVRGAEAELARREAAHDGDVQAFQRLDLVTADELELCARALAASRTRRVSASEALAAARASRTEVEVLRVDAERETRGLELARVRLVRVRRDRQERAEQQLVELRSGRR